MNAYSAFFIFDDIVEIGILVAVVVIVGIFLLLKHAFSSASGTTVVPGSTSGTWVNPPASIPPSPATGEFKFHVDFTASGSATAVGQPDRDVAFTLTLGTGSGKIATVTGKAGAKTVDALSTNALSDTNGDIVVQVALERGSSATLAAVDVRTGDPTPLISFSAP